MGKIVREILEEKNEEYYFVDSISEIPKNEKNCIVIDFSHFSKIDLMIRECVKRKYPVIIATTGYSGETLNKIIEGSKEIPILLSSNTSLGINVMNNIVREITEKIGSMFDIEIMEKHHNKKIDSPSGTAKTLLNIIEKSLNEEYKVVYGREGLTKREKKEIGIHSVRGGTVVGEHTVMFLGEDEIIEITHKALSKRVFASGAIECSKILIKKPKGIYTMEDIFKSKGEL